MAKHTIDLEATLDTRDVESKIDELNSKGINVQMETSSAKNAIEDIRERVANFAEDAGRNIDGLGDRLEKAFNVGKVIIGLRQLANEIDKISNIFNNLDEISGGGTGWGQAGEVASAGANVIRSAVGGATTGAMVAGAPGAVVGGALGAAVGALESWTEALKKSSEAMKSGEKARDDWLKKEEDKKTLAAGTSEVSVEKRDAAVAKIAELQNERQQKENLLKDTKLEDFNGNKKQYGKSLKEQTEVLGDLDKQIALQQKIVDFQNKALEKQRQAEIQAEVEKNQSLQALEEQFRRELQEEKQKEIDAEVEMGKNQAEMEKQFAKELREEEEQKQRAAKDAAKDAAKKAAEAARQQEAAARKAAKEWERLSKIASEASQSLTKDFADAITTTGQIGGYMSNTEYGFVHASTTVEDPQLKQLEEQTKLLNSIDKQLQNGDGFGATYA